MPNDLTTKRNLFNRRPESREYVRSESRQNLASSGFTATIWTLSGVVLVACGNLEEFLGLDDDGGGGNTLHVRSSAVQGARLYFDTDGVGGVTQIEKDAQDALYPEGFITDAAGQAHGIPAEFYGKPFIADLTGAINVETGESLSVTEYASIANARGLHLLASPITEYITEQTGKTPEEVVADLINEQDAESEAVQAQLQAILNPANYLGGDEGVEALSYHITTLTNPTPSEVESQAVQLLTTDPTDPNRDTLIIVDARDMTKTIGTDSTYIATIHAVSHGDSPVRYSIVDMNGASVSGGDFSVDSQGVVSVADGATLTADNMAIPVYVLVSNGDSEQTVKIDVTVEPVVTLSHATSAGSVAENEAGAIAVEGIETSDTVTATDFTISDALGVTAGYAGMFEMEAVTGATNTWNLKLTDTAELDFEAIPNGVINLRVHVEPSNHAPSNILEIAVTVTDDPDDIAFSGVVRGEVTKDSGAYEVSGAIAIANQDGATVDASDGTYGDLVFDSGTWTYTLDNTDPIVQDLLEGQLLIDTAELTVGSVTQNISIIVMGANEDVHFVETATPTNRVSAVDVPTNIEIGTTAMLSGGSFALGNIFTGLGISLEGQLAGSPDPSVEFADSVSADLRGLFSLSASGDLEFTGTNADALRLGVSTISLNLLVNAPEDTTEQIPLNLQVNIINAVDDGMADYVVTENRDTMELTVALVDADPASATYSGDPDGVVGGVRFQWFTTTDGGVTKTAIANANSAILDISASAQLPAGTTYGVTITYTDNHDIANGETTEFDVLATPVRFTPPTEMALMANENDANWQLQLEATSDAGGDTSPIARYEFVGTAPSGFMLNESTGRITLTGDGLDYEAGSTHTLTIRATDSRSPAENGETRITITVQNAQEGPAEYEITRAEADNGGVITTTLTVALIDADPNSATYSGDPDGVVGAVMFRWFTTDGTTKTYLGEASTSNTRDISANPNLSYGVEVSYTDGEGMDEEFDVFASSVRFTTPPPASIDVSEAASADYATLGVLGTFAATSSAEPPQTVAYSFEALDDAGMPVVGATGLFSISNGEISLLSNVDFETTPQYTLIITASAPKEANSMEMDTAVARVTINVVNDQDGDAEYEVTENQEGTILTVELVAGDFDINTPDGAPTNPAYRWFTTADGGMNKDYITNADSASFTIADHPLEAGEIYGVTVSYQDPLYDPSDPSTLTEIDVLASPIDFTDGTDSVPSYTGTINEDGTLLADNAGDDIPLPQVMASVDDAPMGSEIKYGFLVDAGTGMTIGSRLGFKIDEDDGTITVSSTIPGTDFNYDLDPPRESITLTVRATYDSNGATAGGEVHTRDVDVVITVNDLNDETPEFAPLQIVENSGAVAGIPTLAGATTGIDMLTGTAGADHITGGDGADEIASGGGNDHIFGDAGNDEITLSTDADNVETIYYRFASGTPGAWTATDGTDTIINFRRGEDRIVLIDSDDGSVIDLDTFINHNNLAMRVLWEDDEYVSGVEIMFGTTKVLEIQYHSSSHEQAFDFETNNWILGPAERYLGEILNDDVATNDPTGYISNTQEVGTTSLLPNYFNVKAGDDNLQIIATADLPTLGVDVFISESRTSADGAFATISATDADVAVIDLSYRIAGGSGATIFELATDNTLSVASTATLDYETATEYTLIIEATDGTNSAMQTITIGITDVNDVAPSIVPLTINGALTDGAAAGTDTGIRATITDDARGDDFEITYKNLFGGANIEGFELRHISGTTYGLYTTEEFDYETNTAIVGVGIGIVIGVSDILDGTTTRTTEITEDFSFTVTDANDNGPTVTVAQTVAGTNGAIDERISGNTDAIAATGITITIDDADRTAGHKSGVLGITPIFTVRNGDDGSINSAYSVVEDDAGNWVLQYDDTLALSAETDSTISLRISVSDGENTPDITDTFTLTVNNVDEGPGVYRVDVPLASNLEVRGDDITAMLGSGITPIAGATTGDDSALDGTTADEYIYGDAGDDTITSGGGADHIIGGAGDDSIALSSAEGSVETIYYRFTSTDSGAWTTTDGFDTITNFRRGEDRLVLLDNDGSVIDLNTFLNHDNLAIRTIVDNFNVRVEGVEIFFGTTKILEIQYHSDSHVRFYDNEWVLEPTERYLGDLPGDDVSAINDPTGYDSNTKDVATTSLLANYFNVVGGTLMTGTTLTVAQVTPDPDGINGDVTYQWYKEVNGTRTMLTADSGNPLQYTLKSGDDPATELFGVVVIYNDNAGVEYTAANRLVDVQANYAPEITGFTDADGMALTLDPVPTVSISTNMNRVQEVLASITATDRNTVDALTYAFVVNGKPTLYTSGGLETFEVTINNEVVEAIDEGGFNIDPTTGRITFSGTLHQDAHDDSKLPLTLTVQVSDGTETATADIKVDFLLNTGSASFPVTYTNGAPDNFYVGTQLGINYDSDNPDPDGGLAGNLQIGYYRLVEDPDTGETSEVAVLVPGVNLFVGYVFTPEDAGHKIIARGIYTDGTGNKEVVDHITAMVVPEPAEASSARVIVTERIADDSVITYATTDGTINTNTDLSYEITAIKDASDTDVTSAGAFEIRDGDETAGTIYRKQGDANRLDHETNDSYTLTVTVTDSSNAPSWITSGAYAATFATDVANTGLANNVRSFAVDASTNSWTYMIAAGLTAGNSVTETFTITLTPTDTDIAAKTETIKVELGHDANGYYYILDDGAQVNLGTTLTFTTFSGTFKTLADELTTTTHDIVIEVGDINEAPTETTSFAPGTTKASVHRATTTSNTEDVSTGYRVTIADEDGAHFNTMLTLMSTTTGFVFKEVMGQANTYELFLEKGVAIDRNKIVEYQFSDGVNTVTENVTVQIEADGEAKIPDRQAETHEPINPDYNPDDDPIAGIVPIPDADPYA